MAVSGAGLSDGEFFTSLGMLIIQGRKWDAFRRTRGRGLHCPTVRNSSPPHHQCSLSNIECQTALSFRNTIQLIWQCGGTVVIEVILLPECGHVEPSLLIEKWTLQPSTQTSKMSELSLMQAVDSMIHFSQLCSWWSSTNGSKPRNVQYKIYEKESEGARFTETPALHKFMVCNGVDVKLESLPRQNSIPELVCGACTVKEQKMDVGSPSRGRNFMHRRQGSSRHSSASSDSVSSSLSLNLGFRASLSSSPSSRGSSRTGSPCLSRSPSERSLALAFETSLQNSDLEALSSDHTSRFDSGFIDNTSRELPTINQDEELANQLDSLSDSDLSDDYVIDGPVGSPGLVGTPIASPDDSRVQMLQSTFAGFHCRHPAFDRLMNDVESNEGNRTRHSSLDSAVSNLERLDLRTRRQLNRTSSDGQDFENSRENLINKSEKEFFIRGRKKRHKIHSPEPMDFSNSQYMSNSTFYASFRTDTPKSASADHDILDFTSFPDDFNSSINGFKILQPQLNSTPTTVGFVTELPRPSNLPIDYKFNPCDSPTSSRPRKNYPIAKRLLHRDPSFVPVRSSSADSIKTRRTPTTVNPQPPKTLLQHNVPSCQQANRDASPNATSKEMDIRHTQDVQYEYSKEDIKDKVLTDSRNVPTTSVLLRSPPSKLRILPRHCVEKNYLHNPPRQTVHKLSTGGHSGPARRLQFSQTQEKSVVTSPAPIRRNNAVRFEFDEDMPKLNQRSSRSICRGKCMKKDGIVPHNHTHLPPTHRLLGSFEESIIHNRLEILGSVDGFHAQLGASGSFCPAKVKLPVPVRFFHVSDDNAPSPYMGTMSLKGKECGKRGYHIPRKGTIQLTLFNPNNSVVKVFVILYDVSDMPPGHRTFLRHRIFSKSTLIPHDHPPAVDHNANVIKKEATGSQTKYLRYFVHLWLESSKTNKIYIHGDMKILFSLASNEWDSGNTFELMTETEFPKNPRYSSKR